MSKIELMGWIAVFVLAAIWMLRRRRPAEKPAEYRGQIPPRPSPPAPPPADDGIRWAGDLTRVKAEPGDVFVLHADRFLNREQAAQLRKWFRHACGDAPLLILDKGLKLDVIQMPLGGTETQRAASREQLPGEIADPVAYARALAEGRITEIPTGQEVAAAIRKDAP